jgi:hypothetical protein
MAAGDVGRQAAGWCDVPMFFEVLEGRFPMQRRVHIVAAVAVLLVAGCSQKPASNRPQTVPVKGTITLKGQPLAKATVSFQPDGKGSGASGITDDSGGFVLSTFAAKDGAVPGKYKVAVTKMDDTPSGKDMNDAGYAPPTASSPPPKSLVPEQYADPAKSGLTAEVATGAANAFDFDLK